MKIPRASRVAKDPVPAPPLERSRWVQVATEPPHLAGERFICSRRRPWRPGDGPVIHPDAKEVKSGTYRCPACKTEFEQIVRAIC